MTRRIEIGKPATFHCQYECIYLHQEEDSNFYSNMRQRKIMLRAVSRSNYSEMSVRINPYNHILEHYIIYIIDKSTTIVTLICR